MGPGPARHSMARRLEARRLRASRRGDRSVAPAFRTDAGSQRGRRNFFQAGNRGPTRPSPQLPPPASWQGRSPRARASGLVMLFLSVIDAGVAGISEGGLLIGGVVSASPSLYGRGDDERRRAGEASHRDLMLRVAKTWAPGTLRCRAVSASQGTWNGYSPVDVGPAWPENPSNRPSRRLKSRASPIRSRIPLGRIRTRTVR